ncbi:MAG: penicillin acylase family protein, partial [Desulfobacterales bacterium]|nr:penicillin acylase family protein [Desulfobacterales bacterium]
WVVGPKSSPNGKPIVANDPHLESSTLPGPWYPCGLITPEGRAVGVIIPGIPGMVIGRTDHFSIGVTNAYGDTQDLYVETPDPQNPERYLEGKKSIPFEVIEETLKIKDKKTPKGFREDKIKIRLTKRGPVISDVFPELKTDKVLTVRWSIFETMNPSLGFNTLLSDKTVYDIRKSLGNTTTLMLNFVFADTKGNIGWQTTGRLPVRSEGSGLVPYLVKNSKDNWSGWIPFDEMPQSYNPQKGWLGTCNHKTITSDYPYYYSSHFSPSYRYQRLIELLDRPGIKTVDDHWQFQRDTMNLMAKQIAPIMEKALSAHEDTKKMGEILAKWDFMDDPDKAGPTVFQAVYREFAILTYQDELGSELTETMLSVWYFWQERLNSMILAGGSPWFDNGNTKDKKENMNDLFHQAALVVKEDLGAAYGKNPRDWKWGKAHQMEFVSPIRREGFGKGFIGAGSHPAPGSQETLYRGQYKFTKPYNVYIPASLRMVADLGDNDKILAVLPGGVSGRLFDKHMKDQVKSYMNGDKMYWWFSDTTIKKHEKHTLVLNPE